MEPNYVSVDDDGNLGGAAEKQMPKWRTPADEWERRVLRAVGLMYWPKEAGAKDLKTQIIVVKKSMSPMGAVIPKYPTEFIDEVISWFAKRTQFGGYKALKGMYHKFNDDEWRQRFIAAWLRDHKDVQAKEYGQELPEEKKWSYD